MEQKMNLSDIEVELGRLVSTDKASWVRIYELMELVERESLYSPSHRSFTAWVNDFAIKSKVHVSLLWSRKKAGKMYAEYQRRAAEKGKTVPDIKEVAVSPDNFVLIEKIAGSNVAVADDLTEKVIAGTLGRSDLKNAWATVRSERKNVRVNAHDKPQAANPGHQYKEQEDRENQGRHGYQGQQEPEIEAEIAAVTVVTAADIVLALSRQYWLPESNPKQFQSDRFKLLPEFAVNTGTSHYARRIDALVLESLSPAESGRIAIHGIEIKVSRSDLLSDHKMQEYTDFVDFFWIAVPDTLVEDTKSIAADGWGILSVGADKTACVVVPAERGEPIFRDKTMEMAILKLI